jgi:hypothetical protein
MRECAIIGLCLSEAECEDVIRGADMAAIIGHCRYCAGSRPLAPTASEPKAARQDRSEIIELRSRLGQVERELGEARAEAARFAAELERCNGAAEVQIRALREQLEEKLTEPARRGDPGRRQ